MAVMNLVRFENFQGNGACLMIRHHIVLAKHRKASTMVSLLFYSNRIGGDFTLNYIKPDARASICYV